MTLAKPNRWSSTRYEQLGYRQDHPTYWRIVDTESGNSVGPLYRTRAELLADLDRYAREAWGIFGRSVEAASRIDAHGERVAGDGRPRNTAERWHVDGEPEQDILIMDENRLVVATVMHGTDEQGEKAAQHTAALLAAAPRLADSVSALLEIVDRYVAVSATGANRQELEETIAEANAALNEALPETW